MILKSGNRFSLRQTRSVCAEIMLQIKDKETRIMLMQGTLPRLIAGLVRNERGSAAVEFAVIVPIMLVMFFGVVEAASGIAVDRKVTLVARTLSDLTSQSSCVTQADIDGFALTGKAMMTPYSTTPLLSTITAIYVDENLDAKVQWSKGSAPKSGTVSIPPGLKIAKTNLILAEVEYLYKPVGIGYVMKSNINLKDLTYTRPRQTASVTYQASTC
jgi:Flp pilus assembly protein TadG